MTQKQFTQKAQDSLNNALYFARELGHTYIGSEHILLGLLAVEDSIAASVLAQGGITSESVRAVIIKNVGVGEPSSVSARDMTPRSKKIIENSAQISARLGSGYIGTEHILLSMLAEEDCFACKIITAAGLSPDEIASELSARFSSGDAQEAASGISKNSATSRKDEQISGCPTLSKYGRDLCRRAREGEIDPIIGRDSETERMIQILSRRSKNNPCLIGEPGVGKTAVVEGLAQRIAHNDRIPDSLKDKLIVTLDVSAMIAGAKYRGEFEERMKGVMDEVMKNKNIILFIDEIHNIIGAGGAEGAIDAANIIKPALARGEMQIIGATTIDEYRRHIEHDAALERRFQSVLVGEPTKEEAEAILFGLRDKYEAHHKVKISDDAVKAAVSLSVRYISDRYLPDKAIDLIDEAASKLRIAALTPSDEYKKLEDELKKISAEKEEAIVGEDFEGAAKLRDREKELKKALDSTDKTSNTGKDTLTVTKDDVAEIVAEWTKIPVTRLEEDEGKRLLELDKLLKARVIGQDAAAEAVARAIRRGRSGMRDPKRPLGSFIFLGPTGVGKTELSKTLADIMYAGESSMIRVDMSEYMEKHSVSKLIGSPPGYIGYDDGGQLTEKIRRHPYSLVLFDEIEKAHPDVFNILLQILEDGVLTDSGGRKVDFKNTIIIMTSNVGASGIIAAKKLGFESGNESGDEDKAKEAAMSALKQVFRPEFLNRIDDIIIFNKLTRENTEQIAALMLRDVTKRAEEIGISLDFSKDVIASLAEHGYDQVYGARPLRREIVRRVEDPLSEAILSQSVKSGEHITATLDESGAIRFDHSAESEASEK